MKTKALLCVEDVIMEDGELGFSKGKIYIAYFDDGISRPYEDSIYYTEGNETDPTITHWLPDDFIKEYFIETTAGKVLYGKDN